MKTKLIAPRGLLKIVERKPIRIVRPAVPEEVEEAIFAVMEKSPHVMMTGFHPSTTLPGASG